MNPIPKHADERGFLVEFLREDENILNFKGQVYAATFSPGDIRGNHYHNTKTEMFCVLKGKMKILVQHINSDKIEEYILDGNKTDELDRIMVKPKHAHTLINIGDQEAIVLAYGDQVHDHSGPDQHTFQINSNNLK